MDITGSMLVQAREGNFIAERGSNLSEVVQNILFFSNMQLSNEDLSQTLSAGFAIVHSKGKARLIDEILTLKPVALIVDAKYCAQRSMKCDFLLQKIQYSIRATPVFLVNATDVDYISMMADNLIYALIKGPPDFVRLLASLRQYRESSRSRAAATPVRNTVSVPCLLKKLGTSGLIHGRICDLSPKGMKIVLDRDCEDWITGDEIRFSFAKSSDKSSHLDGYGRLRWSEKVAHAPGVVAVKLGLEFCQLPLPTLHEFLDILNTSRASF